MTILSFRLNRITKTICLACFLFILGLLYLYYNRPNPSDKTSITSVSLNDLQSKIDSQTKLFQSLIERINRLDDRIDAEEDFKKKNTFPSRPTLSKQVLPILVIACNRPTVNRPIDKLLQAKSQFVQPSDGRRHFEFPIYVSHGCSHETTGKVLTAYGDKINLLRFNDPVLAENPPLIIPSEKAAHGYRRVASHYKVAIDRLLKDDLHRPGGQFDAVVIVEDDLDLADDFLSYFAATRPLLVDPTYRLFCVSAWNDNGRSELVDTRLPEKLYRTDFFPGLGWMLTASFWREIRDNWPSIYWDEYLRKPNTTLNRSCLRPELSRTYTFGEKGVSYGQHFRKYLKSILLNRQSVDFLAQNLSYLHPDAYNREWHETVYQNSRQIESDEFLKIIETSADRLPSISVPLTITYSTRKQFQCLADRLGVMSDVKSGMFRNAYQGVVPLFWNNHRLFLAPNLPWTGYNRTWV